jgi:predicted PurR-regulated permease PerM
MVLFVITFCAAMILTSICAALSKHYRNPLAFFASVVVLWVVITAGYFALMFYLWDNTMHSNPQPANVGRWSRS